ncbi:competence protein CoiA family protein [Mesorhizobium sp.]|uniref:competence protein CoiA family protein n=1 Tax=Mesorhizobium sp. TaxID=1871066 RepID=UPI00344DCA48
MKRHQAAKMDHEQAHKSYGTDRARLVHGKRPDGTLAHIGKVARGLACGCVCPACDGQLVARLKDDQQVPHFAHHGGEACGGGPETVLHLLAKEAFRSDPKLFLPERPGLDNKPRRDEAYARGASRIPSARVHRSQDDHSRSLCACPRL